MSVQYYHWRRLCGSCRVRKMCSTRSNPKACKCLVRSIWPWRKFYQKDYSAEMFGDDILRGWAVPRKLCVVSCSWCFPWCTACRRRRLGWCCWYASMTREKHMWRQFFQWFWIFFLCGYITNLGNVPALLRQLVYGSIVKYIYIWVLKNTVGFGRELERNGDGGITTMCSVICTQLYVSKPSIVRGNINRLVFDTGNFK